MYRLMWVVVLMAAVGVVGCGEDEDEVTFLGSERLDFTALGGFGSTTNTVTVDVSEKYPEARRVEIAYLKGTLKEDDPNRLLPTLRIASEDVDVGVIHPSGDTSLYVTEFGPVFPLAFTPGDGWDGFGFSYEMDMRVEIYR